MKGYLSIWQVRCILYFAFFMGYHPAFSMTCQSHGDCNQWESMNCACGVSARCNGITQQNTVGTCQCFGAVGSCAQSNEAYTNRYMPYLNRDRRYGRHYPGKGARRNAIHDNSGQVDSITIER